MNTSKSRHPPSVKSNQVRIIAGTLRGRKITFPDSLDLRPTPDRVRETLFNWLEPKIRGAHCLDLFAGSGALSIEALSRGAEDVVAVEHNPTVIHALRHQSETLQLNGLTLVQSDSRAFLTDRKDKEGRKRTTPFDIIFLDPPYQSTLLLECLQLLCQYPGIHSKTWVYCESNGSLLNILSEQWTLLKEKKAGQVYFYLIKLKTP